MKKSTQSGLWGCSPELHRTDYSLGALLSWCQQPERSEFFPGALLIWPIVNAALICPNFLLSDSGCSARLTGQAADRAFLLA